MSEQTKKRIFSGIQSTGTFTLGNYIGAVKNWNDLQEGGEFECIYSIVDMHAITVKQDPNELRKNTLSAFATLLACGLDPDKSTIFIQSHVKTHAELNWILACSTQYGELTRMTQFKDKSARYSDDINAGLLNYPTLMAADILAYNADLVPVGIDQKQHLELARTVAKRFNSKYGDYFVIPEPFIKEIGAKIMSLQEPMQKMSKSDSNANAFIGILDDKDTIVKKFKKAKTDSEALVAYREGKDGINNLMTILSTLTGDSYEKIESDFSNKGYGDFKVLVGEVVADHLQPVREKYNELMKNREYLRECYIKGAEKALKISEPIIKGVYNKVGFVEF